PSTRCAHARKRLRKARSWWGRGDKALRSLLERRVPNPPRRSAEILSGRTIPGLHGPANRGSARPAGRAATRTVVSARTCLSLPCNGSHQPIDIVPLFG